MFTSLFGQKSGAVPDAVKAVLENYRSDVFLFGVTAVAKSMQWQKQGEGHVLSIDLPFACASESANIEALLELAGVTDVKVELNCQVQSSRPVTQSLDKVKNVIAVASGKGGVGKSTCSVNIARALQLEGASVGILDADIYGPSIPLMLGKAQSKPVSEDGKTMLPVMADGLASMSLGYLIEANDAAVWRGPMASTALLQLLNETQWPELDYLIVDLPPGTGDIQLTLTQRMPVTASVVVTTPQNIALADAVKGIAMFEKVNVPVLGVIENMSYHLCSECGHQEPIFGQGGGEKISDQYAVPLLAQVPLNGELREVMDNGQHQTLFENSGVVGECYRTIAKKISASLYYQWDKYSPAVAEIIVTDD